ELQTLKLQLDGCCLAVADALKRADVLLLCCGAGFSADSGLATYEEIANIKPYQDLGYEYHDICRPEWLTHDPEIFYGFWGTCFNDYRETQPHEGYNIIRQWRDTRFGANNRCSRAIRMALEQDTAELGREPEPYEVKGHAGAFFVYTSNVDAHAYDFFEPCEVRECHGNTEASAELSKCLAIGLGAVLMGANVLPRSLLAPLVAVGAVQLFSLQTAMRLPKGKQIEAPSAWQMAVTEPEQCDELCYVDPDAERWAQLAEVAHEEVPDVKKGNVRLQGNFLGTATTHTHQMDLNIGVNMEMPSQVAAKTMKLLTNAGLVPETQAMLDGSKRSIFGALADYFRKDSTQDMTDDVSSMIMNSVQMKLDDVHASYEKQQKELQQALEKSQAEASSLADQLKEIQERDEQNLDTSGDQEPSEAQKVGQMPEHQNGDAKIAELTTQVRDLEAALQRHCAELEVIHTQAAKDSAARGHVENALQEAQQKLQAAEQEAQAKHSELSELKTGHARISGELESLKALPPPLDAEEVRAELQASQRQCEGLQQKLTLTEAMCRDATRRAEDLEAQVSKLTGEQAQAEAQAAEASRLGAEAAAECNKLRVENQEIREALTKITLSEKRLAKTVAEMTDRQSSSARRSASEAKGAPAQELKELLAQHEALQAEHEKCLKSLDDLRGERAELQSLKQTCTLLRREADQARAKLAVEVAGKAAAVAQATQDKEAAKGLKKALAREQIRFAEASSERAMLDSKVKELEEQLQGAGQERATERDSQLTELRSRLAGEEREGQELRRQLNQALDEQQLALEKAKAWEQHLQDAQGRIADLTEELEAVRKVRIDPMAEVEVIDAVEEESQDAEANFQLTPAEERQVRSRPGLSRSVIVRSMPKMPSSGSLGAVVGSSPSHVAAAPVTYKSMAVPRTSLPTAQAVRRTGKVTHIGTTTRAIGYPAYGAVSMFPAEPVPSGTVTVPRVVSPPMTLAPVTSVQMPTNAGLVHGQVGIQITGVRRIR
ncbi:unnamed protein product, partial [Effrenium voratum]